MRSFSCLWLLPIALLVPNICASAQAQEPAIQDALNQASTFVAGEFNGTVDLRLAHAIVTPPVSVITETGETPNALDGSVYALESDALVAVSDYEIGTPLRNKNNIIVPVDFTVIAYTQGKGAQRHFVRPNTAREQIRLRMTQHHGIWKVRHPPLPHVSAEILRNTLSAQLDYAKTHILPSPHVSNAQRATFKAAQTQLSELKALMVPAWPEISPVSARMHVTSGNPHVSMMIPDSNGTPLYRLSCHEGEFESADEGDFNHLYQCKLWDMRGQMRGDLFSPTPEWNRSRTRASFYGEQVNGACADHPYYGKDRRFHFMGMQLRLRIDDLKQPDMLALLRGAKPDFTFTLTVSAQPDAAATNAFVGPAPEQCSSYFTIDTSGKMMEKITLGDDESAND